MKIKKWNQYQQISTTEMNDVSKDIFESILLEFCYGFLTRGQSVIISDVPVIHQDTGTNLQTIVEAFIGIHSSGKIISNSVVKTLVHDLPSTNKRIDIIQATLKYTDSNNQVKNFIDPNTGIVSPVSVPTEFLIDVDISIKKGTENATPVAPSTDAGYIKIAEVVVNTNGQINNTHISNVTSLLGEANTGWTLEQSSTQLIIPFEQHRLQSVIDHPNGSVTIEKLNDNIRANLRTISSPSTYIPASDILTIHEITVPAGKTLKLHSMGVSILNNISPIATMIIEIGTYSGSFSQTTSTNARNAEFTNTFAQNIVVQIRLKNGDSVGHSVTGFANYSIY